MMKIIEGLVREIIMTKSTANVKIVDKSHCKLLYILVLNYCLQFDNIIFLHNIISFIFLFTYLSQTE